METQGKRTRLLTWMSLACLAMGIIDICSRLFGSVPETAQLAAIFPTQSLMMSLVWIIAALCLALMVGVLEIISGVFGLSGRHLTSCVVMGFIMVGTSIITLCLDSTDGSGNALDIVSDCITIAVTAFFTYAAIQAKRTA